MLGLVGINANAEKPLNAIPRCCRIVDSIARNVLWYLVVAGFSTALVKTLTKAWLRGIDDLPRLLSKLWATTSTG